MKKVTTAATILALLALSLCLIPGPIHADSLSLSPSQGIVGAQVTTGSLCGYGTGTYQLFWGEDEQLINEGTIQQDCISISFIVPEAPRGKHKVTFKAADQTVVGEFTVMPSISISATTGTVGSNITVTGKGFNSNETNIQIIYDNDTVQTDIAANDKGSWQSTFKIPASVHGNHSIDAKGATPATEVENKTLTVTPKISINPTSGWVGTVVGISGSGFAGSETDIRVTYDGMTLKTAIAADTKGSWQSSFTTPTSAKGSHEVKAYGASTAESDVPATSFIVSPGIKLELVSGYLGGAVHVGDNFLVIGVGFEANETGIIVNFDGTQIASGIVADAKGSWSNSLEIAKTITGEHTIDASGQITKADDIVDAIIIVSPKIEVEPTAGAVGDEITIRATGFSGDSVITISYDGTNLDTTTVTDAEGSFVASFKIPAGKSGDHLVTVTDIKASVFTTTLNLESIPPATPQLISPAAGSKLGFIGKTTVTFDWADVEDPSGVYYVLEISHSADFAGTVIRKEGLTESNYTLAKDEALAKGDYYWRVRAVDGAENQSDWTTGQLLKVGGIELWLLIVIAVVVIIIIVVSTRARYVRRKDKWE